jgi:small subunit ribosomal protein S6
MQRTYEAMLVVTPEYDEEAVAGVIERYEKLIEERGGAVDKVTKWGKRKLAYEINDFTEGVYVLMHFTGSSEVCEELERVFKISGDIIRFLIVRDER